MSGPGVRGENTFEPGTLARGDPEDGIRRSAYRPAGKTLEYLLQNDPEAARPHSFRPREEIRLGPSPPPPPSRKQNMAADSN